MSNSRGEIANDLETSLRTMQEGHQAGLWTALPCIVTSVNFSAMTLECQPAIQGINIDESNTETAVNLPKLVDVPICFPNAQGFILTFPLAPGDEVLVIFASRCIDAWWSLGGVQPPLEYRMHDLSDGFAIPGPRSTPRVFPNISTSNVELRNEPGTVKISLSATYMTLVGPVNVQGNLSVTGNITANGEVTAHNTGTPIPLSAHIHSGVTSGGGTSGGPLP